MPGGDGTGPMGMGPMTGRAAGYCAGYPTPGYMSGFGGRGFWGRGRRGGRGWRNWKADVNPEMTTQIGEEARKRGIMVIGEIPYDDAFTKAQIMKATIVEYTGGRITERVKALWRQVTYALG